MIFYFSGTGNSRYVALQLAARTGDEARAISLNAPPLSFISPSIGRTDCLGIIFPIHAWGMPLALEKYIKNTDFSDFNFTYIYSVCTCGDDTGTSAADVRKCLSQKGWVLDSMWSIQMPNTYVSFPFFNTDSLELVRTKLEYANQQLPQIAQAINHRERGHFEVYPGHMPWIKSHVLRPLFNRFLSGDKGVRVAKTCTQCKACVRVCPLHNISLNKSGLPKWNGHCTTCLACYHNCPHHSIEFSKFSRGKGQYTLRQAQIYLSKHSASSET